MFGLKKASFLLVAGCAVVAAIGCSGEMQKPDNLIREPAGKISAINKQSANDGAWGPLIRLKDETYSYPGDMHHARPSDGWWFAPIHATLLSNGKVVLTGWVRPKEKLCEVGMGRAYGATFVLDPSEVSTDAEGVHTIQPINEDPAKPGDVMYCTGHSPLDDGRVFYIGGATYKNLEGGIDAEREYGLNYARIFDPRVQKITRIPQSSPGGAHPAAHELASSWNWYQQGMMWYPTVLHVPGSRWLVAGGLSRQTNPFTEPVQNRSLIFFNRPEFDQKKNPWSVWVSHENAIPEIDIRAFDYPHLYLLPKPVQGPKYRGDVAVFGGKESGFAYLTLDPSSNEKERMWPAPNGVRKDSTGAIENGSDTTSALLGTGEIMMMGGGQFGAREGQRIETFDPLKMKNQWQAFDTGITRSRAASILLPDGEVLILNGERSWNGDSVGDRRQPTLFDPYSKSFKNLAAWKDDPDDRGYHNFALLLSDGRVLLGGGRTSIANDDGLAFRIGCERSDVRFFFPPYLFKGPRPVLNEMSQLNLGLGEKTFDLSYQGPPLRSQRAVVLMALGSETHHFDQNQRYIPLRFAQKTPGHLTVKSPLNETIAPAGDYFLYIISDRGVPSTGRPVHLSGGQK